MSQNRHISLLLLPSLNYRQPRLTIYIAESYIMKTIAKKSLLALTATAVMGLSAITQAADRDVISIVGSSTVYPFATVVAERFGKGGAFKTPKIESTGTGGGMKLFCAGSGIDTPDITNASRAIKSSELDSCGGNNVTGVVEVKIGYDGLTLANAKGAPQWDITLKDVYLALAKEIPDGKGGMKANPHKTWKDVNAALPATKIEVIGPPPTSGTRDSFNELAMEGGCGQDAQMKALKSADSKKFETLCRTIREDGAYIEAGENDNLIVQKLAANPNAIGVFGYSFLEENADKVKAVHIAGVDPSIETVLDKSYPLSRPLFFYVKKSHVGKVPGITEFLAEFTSEKAIGQDGYLLEKGLIPLAPEELAKVQANVKAMKSLTINAKLP